MKKKPKISYRELAKGETPGAVQPAPEAPNGARGQAPGTAETPDAAKGGVRGQGSGQPSPAVEAAVVVPNAPKKPENTEVPKAPRRVSSPIDVAATLRLTPPVGIPIVKAGVTPAATVSPVVPAVPNAWPLVPGPQPLVPDPRPLAPDTPAVASTVEDYATILMRRLEAMAPVDLGEDDEGEADRRPLRERVRDRAGVADLLMFRIGEELFATDLASVEEAVTLPEIHHLPEMPAAMLGAFNLRGRLTPVYSPSHVIGVPLRGAAQAALLVRSGTRRLGLAVDDVEDVFQVDLATVREAPGTDDADGILLGVAHHGKELVAIVDAEALVAACVTGHAMEMTA